MCNLVRLFFGLTQVHGSIYPCCMARPPLTQLDGFTTRFSAEDARWIRQRAHERGCSMNDVVRVLVENERTLFRLPSMMAQRLSADRGERSVQQYLIDLLTARYGELIKPRRFRRTTWSSPDFCVIAQRVAPDLIMRLCGSPGRCRDICGHPRCRSRAARRR